MALIPPAIPLIPPPAEANAVLNEAPAFIALLVRSSVNFFLRSSTPKTLDKRPPTIGISDIVSLILSKNPKESPIDSEISFSYLSTFSLDFNCASLSDTNSICESTTSFAFLASFIFSAKILFTYSAFSPVAFLI